jgi:hypothetical protein
MPLTEQEAMIGANPAVTATSAAPAPAPRSDGREAAYPAADALRRDVLSALADGRGRAIAEIPRRWPVMHAHVAAVVGWLVAEGRLERVPDPRSGGAQAAYRLPRPPTPPP